MTPYISHPPPLTSTPPVCVRISPWVLSIWCQIDYYAIVAPQTSQLTLVILLSLNVSPYSVALYFYTASTCYPHINPGVHTITFVFPRFVCILTLSNLCTSNVKVFCTHMGFMPAMRPSSKYKNILCFPVAHPSPLCAS